MSAALPSPAGQAGTDDINWGAHRGSCRVFYAERRCTCGADDASRPAEPTGELREQIIAALPVRVWQAFHGPAETPSRDYRERAADALLSGPLAPLLAKLRAVEALAERLGDESREFYYDNRHTHEYGINYVSGMGDGMEQIADRILQALDHVVSAPPTHGHPPDTRNAAEID